MGQNVWEDIAPPRPGRMKTLPSSSGIVATLAQKAGHTLLRRKYCSTFDT
jgi:hypothetical protein